jgi:tRNA/tmRNA/rRNA uracil-C5-methylase (TrmA/RlmC/RlmD family)
LFLANTKGAEVLYSLIKDSMKLDTDTILLDICCGTGTIGITLANVKIRNLTFSIIENILF